MLSPEQQRQAAAGNFPLNLRWSKAAASRRTPKEIEMPQQVANADSIFAERNDQSNS
jgi:hypothetical protein